MGNHREIVKVMVSEAIDESSFVSRFERALESAEEQGERNERRRLIERLNKYSKDSMVAKLLRELIEMEG